MNLKKSIITLLKEKDNYTETDDILINELSFNIKILSIAKKDLLTRGAILFNAGDLPKIPYDVSNKSLDIYDRCLKNIKDIYIKLGINPQERKKLNLQTVNDDEDEFDRTFN